MKINDIIERLSQSRGKLIIFHNGKRLERYFRDIYPTVKNAASWLYENGFDDTCTVGIIAKNDFHWVITDLASIWNGIKVIPLESIPEIEYYLKCGLKLSAVAIDNDYAGQSDTIEKYGVKCIRLKELVRIEEPAPAKGRNYGLATPHSYDNKEIFSFKSTSGSTGLPKLIGQTVESVENSIWGVQQLFNHSESDSILVFLPLNLLQQRYWLYSAIIYQFTVIIVPKHYVYAAIMQEQPTVIMGIPYIYECIREDFTRLLERDSNLQTEYERFLITNTNYGSYFKPFMDYMGGRINYLWTGSAPISYDLLEFYFKMGIPIYQGYGMNETCIISKNYPGNNKIGSVGKLFPNVEIRFDHDGQILVKNKYPICTRYTICAEEDKHTFQNDGYIATGDVGSLDEEGFLYITGRLKEMIALSNSKKIFPVPIEEKLRSYYAIRHCIVYGNDQPFLTALIVPADRKIIKSEIKDIIQDYNNSCQSAEQIYRFFIVFDELEGMFTSQNKIRRNKVYEKYADEFKQLYLRNEL